MSAAIKEEKALRPISILPIFTAHEGKLEEVKTLLNESVAFAAKEPGTIEFTVACSAKEIFLREMYADAEAFKIHMKNVSEILPRLLSMCSFDKLVVLGPKDQLDLIEDLVAPFKDIATVLVTHAGHRK
jgi:quinol monooxygenase YgiN